jgi:nucleoside-diphosphate-sugar epimerase
MAEDLSWDNVKRKLQGQRVLLVGGAGFIGHNLALSLREIGVETMVADNLMVNSVVENLYRAERNSLQRQAYQNFLLDRFRMMRDAGVLLKSVDARLAADLTRVFDEFQPTKVVHLSAISSAVEARKDPGLAFDLQLLTLRNVIEACRLKHNQCNQVMLLSSSTVYGDFETPTVDENTRPRPRGIYANTKYMAERLLRVYHHQHGMGICIVRPSALYGERCVSQRVSQAFIENALTGKPLRLEGGGDGRLDFTYIHDLAEGMIRAMAFHAHDGASQTLNLTFGNARTILDLANIVKSIVPTAILEEAPRANDKPIRGTLSCERAEKVLGFKAQHPIEVGYRRYCEWYVEQWERAKREVNS